MFRDWARPRMRISYLWLDDGVKTGGAWGTMGTRGGYCVALASARQLTRDSIALTWLVILCIRRTWVERQNERRSLSARTV